VKFNRYLLAAAVTAACVHGAGAAPYPSETMSAALAAGPTDAVAGAAEVTVTVALKLSNTEQLTALLQSLYAPGSPNYRKFLTTAQFGQQFGPSPATLAQVTRALQSAGLTVKQTTISQLQATGSVAAIEAAFGVTLETFVVPAAADTPQYSYFAPKSRAQLPAAIADSVESVLGLDTRARLRPHLRQAIAKPTAQTPGQPAAGSAPGLPDPFGSLTVLDFAAYYNVDPLYARGLTGSHQTLGIVTFAAFTPSDAYSYWNSLGLKVPANRITEQQIDGGSGAPSDVSDSM